MTETRHPLLTKPGHNPIAADGNSTSRGLGMFDDPEAVTALAQQSFHAATREAIGENDRLGLPSYGGKDGKIVVRQPRQGKASADPA